MIHILICIIILYIKYIIMSLPKVLNICKKNITNMRIVLTEFEKKEGVKIFTSFNMFKVKYIEIDSKITTLCKIQNC